MRLYGIKTCDTVRKARKFLREHECAFAFIDFDTTPIDSQTLKQWSLKVSVDTLFNTKSKTFRSLNLKNENLSDVEKIELMAKENRLIKRPVLETKDSLIVGFDRIAYERLSCIKK